MPGAFEMIPLVDGKVVLLGVRCQENCPLVFTPLRQLTQLFPELNIVIVGMMRDGRFYPDHGLERIVGYHERQDERFAEAAVELSERTGKPILVATELAVADPANPGPATVRRLGRLCYPSGGAAVTALGHLLRYSMHREARTR